MNIKLIFLFGLILFFGTIGHVAAQNIILENDQAYSFENDLYSHVDSADISFSGMWDKDLGFEHPLLYTDNNLARIHRTQGACTQDIPFMHQAAPAVVDSIYCIRSKNSLIFVQFKVIDLSGSWDRITLQILSTNLYVNTTNDGNIVKEKNARIDDQILDDAKKGDSFLAKANNEFTSSNLLRTFILVIINIVILVVILILWKKRK
jgi:hypothetical protein